MSSADETDVSPSIETHLSNSRIGLCLSGGGFRAALFHLGALRRLNEFGVLSKVDTIASVSGGSILAAHLATHMRPWPQSGMPFDQWDDKIEAPFRRFVQKNLRTGAILRRLLPWNWFRSTTQVMALESYYQKNLTGLLLTELPDRPTFVFCSTDMVNGVSWVFERQRVGSYAAGYVSPAPDWPLARAVAASSCFPPVFSPLPIDGSSRPSWAGMNVSDGGLYDNLGLQPVERHGVVLVSDGGQPFAPTIPTGIFGRAAAYLAVMGKQAGSLRKRLLISQFQDKVRQGTYWGIGSAVRSYRPDAAPGYDKEFATNTIATVRTDMDAFSDPEIAVLMNHGYLLADMALAVHAPHLVAQTTLKQIPYSDWLDQGSAGEALKHSHERWWWGRS